MRNVGWFILRRSLRRENTYGLLYKAKTLRQLTSKEEAEQQSYDNFGSLPWQHGYGLFWPAAAVTARVIGVRFRRLFQTRVTAKSGFLLRRDAFESRNYQATSLFFSVVAATAFEASVNARECLLYIMFSVFCSITLQTFFNFSRLVRVLQNNFGRSIFVQKYTCLR